MYMYVCVHIFLYSRSIYIYIYIFDIYIYTLISKYVYISRRIPPEDFLGNLVADAFAREGADRWQTKSTEGQLRNRWALRCLCMCLLSGKCLRKP